MFIGLLSFSGSWATKCLLLNNKYCKAGPFLIDLNPVKLKYYPFIIPLDKFDERCNVLTKISGRICVPNKTFRCF